MEINSTGINQAPITQLQHNANHQNAGVKSASPANATHTAAATAPPQAIQQQEESPASRDGLLAAVDAMNDFVQPINDSLQFSVDEETGKTVVKVVDLTTQEVIKQMPTEEALAIAKALDKLKGLLIQQQA